MIEKLHKTMYPAFFEELFETGNGITRRVISPRKDDRNPVLMPETEWEQNFVGYPSVIKDPSTGTWRMWYTTRFNDGYGVGYAESGDGAHWERPSLGLISFNGSTDNNYVYVQPGDNVMHSHCVMLDLQDSDEARYKMAVSLEGPKGASARQTGHMALLISPDGLNWSIRQDPMVPIMNDSQSTILTDPDTGDLLAYHRPDFVVRNITFSRSTDDGRRWDGSGQCLWSDGGELERKIDHYALSVSPYGDHLMGFSKVFWRNWYDNRCWIEVMMSRKIEGRSLGAVWQRSSDRKVFIPFGEAGEWDSFMMSPGHGLVEEADGHWFYYDSWNCLHAHGSTSAPESRCCIGRAFIPRNRFHEWYSAQDDSTLRTVPFLTTGSALTLDYDAGPGGIAAEIMLPDGAIPEGFGRDDSSLLTGEDQRGTIVFKGGTLSKFAGRAIRVVFHFPRKAHLYGWGIL